MYFIKNQASHVCIIFVSFVVINVIKGIVYYFSFQNNELTDQELDKFDIDTLDKIILYYCASKFTSKNDCDTLLYRKIAVTFV